MQQNKTGVPGLSYLYLVVAKSADLCEMFIL